MLKPKPLDQVRSEKLVSALEEVTKEPLTRLNVDLPKSVHQDLKVRAAAEGVCMSDLVRLWVIEYLSQPADIVRPLSLRDG